MTKTLAVLFLFLLLPSCSVYESDGRKTFLKDGKRLVSTESLDAMNFEEHVALNEQILSQNCESLSDSELRLYLNEDMVFWRSPESIFFYAYDDREEFVYQLKVPHSVDSTVSLCWHSDIDHHSTND